LISRIREKANNFIIGELEKEGITGIAPSHGDIFTILFQTESIPMTELAARIHRTKPTVTVLVDKLVAKGFVIKEKVVTDNRVTLIKLTEAGLSLQPIIQRISDKLNQIVYQGLTDEEALQLERLLRVVNLNFEQDR